jgi:hypothetical protein
MKFFNQILVYYLILFIISCGAKPPISVPEAREMESRIIYGESREILKASMNILQDMYYSIEEVNSDMGILIATKLSEGKQAEIRKESSVVEKTPIWKKILVGVFIVTIVGGIMFLISGGNNNNNDNSQSSSHHHNPVFTNHYDGNGEIMYRYKVTINVSEYGIDETKLRISAQGEQMKDGEIINVGPIQDVQFYDKFYKYLKIELGY